MDLHFTSDAATEDERAAVDSVLGLPLTGRVGSRSERGGRVAVSGHIARAQRHRILPVLHAVQAHIGWISPGALNYVCRRLDVPPAEAYGVASFYALFSTTRQPATIVHVCDDIACMTAGAQALCSRLESEFGPPSSDGSAGVTWKRSPCLGLCEKAPAAMCQVAGGTDFSVAPIGHEMVLALLRGEPVSGRTPGGSTPEQKSREDSGASGGMKKQHLLSRVGVVDAESLEAYRAHGGYRALPIALETGPAGVIQEVTAAGLTGRGGAAFPAAVKWKAVLEAAVRPHYLVCNADESEPGTFKDRVIMEEDPFSLVESMTIAAFACGVEKGYLYLRGEYPEAGRRLESALKQTRAAGLLGDDILGRGVRFEIEIRRGAGAYICGEETALLNSIEGKRGEPRNKPPFPVQVGLFGKPTVINNVETLINVLPIVLHGGTAYASVGTPRSTGTRLFCLSGCVERPGLYEAAYGTTLGELLSRAGGVRDGRSLQAILLGGAAGGFVRPDELGLPLTLEGVRDAKASLGSGVVMVFDDTVDLAAIVLRIAAFFRDESCGQCIPCRVGTVRQEEALHRLVHAGGPRQEIALLEEIDSVMKDASICGLGHTAGSAIQSAIHRLGLFS